MEVCSYYQVKRLPKLIPISIFSNSLYFFVECESCERKSKSGSCTSAPYKAEIVNTSPTIAFPSCGWSEKRI